MGFEALEPPDDDDTIKIPLDGSVEDFLQLIVQASYRRINQKRHGLRD